MPFKNIDLGQELDTKAISVNGKNFFANNNQFFAKSKSGKMLHLCEIIPDTENSKSIYKKSTLYVYQSWRYSPHIKPL